MNYATIKYFDIANGEGVRTSLFVSGCRRGCKNCFNEEAWSFTAGRPFTPETEAKILESLEAEYIDGLSLLGGEPMEPENQAGLVGFVRRVKERFPRKTVWCFTGDRLEELMAGGRHHTPDTDELLACIDVLIDGPYVEELHDITLRFRGSSNQRVLDLNAMRAQAAARGCSLAEAAILWQDEAVYTTHSMD